MNEQYSIQLGVERERVRRMYPEPEILVCVDVLGTKENNKFEIRTEL